MGRWRGPPRTAQYPKPLALPLSKGLEQLKNMGSDSANLLMNVLREASGEDPLPTKGSPASAGAVCLAACVCACVSVISVVCLRFLGLGTLFHWSPRCTRCKPLRVPASCVPSPTPSCARCAPTAPVRHNSLRCAAPFPTRRNEAYRSSGAR